MTGEWTIYCCHDGTGYGFFIEKSLSSKLSLSYESKPVVRLTVVDEGQPERRQNRRKQGELKAELSMESAG